MRGLAFYDPSPVKEGITVAGSTSVPLSLL
jgi:hypothetical protein